MNEYLVKNPNIVWNAPGALYGFCPKCGAPGEMRESIDGAGKDRCQRKHTYPSAQAVKSPGMASPELQKESRKDSIAQSRTPTRRRNKR